jgi:hypothetical protein
MPVDVIAALIAWLPKTLDVGTETVPLTWSDAQEDIEPKSTPVHGTLTQVSGLPLLHDKSGRKTLSSQNELESIPFTDGTNVYQVAERHIVAVNSLTATVGGTPGTPLVEDTDFEVHTTAHYSTPDAIRFLPGGTGPDDATSFDLDYDHAVLDIQYTRREREVYRLVVNVVENAERGMTLIGATHYLKSRLGALCVQALQDFLLRNRGDTVATGVRVHNHTSLPPPLQSPGEAAWRQAVDVVVTHQSDLAGESVNVTGKVQPAVETT